MKMFLYWAIFAVSTYDIESFSIFKSKKPRLELFDLFKAVSDNDISACKKFLSQNPYNPRSTSKDFCGFTPLHYACGLGRYDIVELLLKNGANKNEISNESQTPLHIVCSITIEHPVLEDPLEFPKESSDIKIRRKRNQEVICKYLLSENADANAQDSSGRTPLHQAVLSDRPELCKLLLIKRARTELKDPEGYTPLHLVCKKPIGELSACENCRKKFKKWQYRTDKNKEKNAKMFESLHEKCRPSFVSVELCCILLDEEADKNIPDREGLTPLHLACISGNLDVCDLLLEFGANIEAFDNAGLTPLHWASKMGQHEVCGLLLNRAANKDAKCKVGCTPLHLACGTGRFEVCRLLLNLNANKEARDKYGRSPLQFACREGKLEVCRLLLEKRACKDSQDEEGLTPLHLTCRFGIPTICRLLLENGVQKDITDKQGRTPLHWAISKKLGEICELLLENGVNTEIQDNLKRTPLQLAVLENRVELCGLLIDRFANTEITNEEGLTPLHSACLLGLADMCRLLLKKRANQRARDHQERTPLHHAILGNHLEICKMLLKAENLEIRDKQGLTPLSSAIKCGHVDIAQLLIKMGARIEVQDASGKTLLHLAVLDRNTKVGKLLLENGANKKAQDNDGHTPSYYACKGGNFEMYDLLQNNNSHHLEVLTDEECSPLHIAAQAGLADFCSAYLDKYASLWKLILGKGTVAEERDILGRTPLQIAVIAQQVEVCRVLLSRFANKFTKDKEGLTPLHLACKGGNSEIVKLLLEWDYPFTRGNDYEEKDLQGQTPLHWACSQGHVDICKLLLECEKHFSVGVNREVADVNGLRPLHWACKNGHLEVCKLLLEKGANIDAQDKYGFTPLHRACITGRTTLTNVLLKNGANSNICSKRGSTPLMIACKLNRSKALLKFLNCMGLTKDLVDNVHGGTALHWACHYGRLEFCTALLEAGFDPNKQDYDGNTPLHISCRNGQDLITEKLLSCGTAVGLNVNALNHSNQTPLHKAVEQSKVGAVGLLLKHGALPAYRDNGAATLLICAAKMKNVEICQLLKKKIDDSSFNRIKLQLLKLVQGHEELVKLFDNIYFDLSLIPQYESIPVLQDQVAYEYVRDQNELDNETTTTLGIKRNKNDDFYDDDTSKIGHLDREDFQDEGCVDQVSEEGSE